MSRLRRAEWWLPPALVLLAGIGGGLLARPECVALSERDRTAYGARPRWVAHFDALSATCGAGLLLHDLEEDYTPPGRWLLAGLGVAGAALYLAAGRQLIGRLRPAASLPGTATILLSYAAGQAVAIALAELLAALSGARTAPADTAWNAISAFSSLGWLREAPGVSRAWIYALLSVVGALGWPAWLAVRGRLVAGRVWFVTAGTYLALLLLGAALFAALEAPRGPAGRQGPPDLPQRLGIRYARGLTQVAAAAGAGIATERLGDRGVTDGTKALLAGIILVGGVGGSAGGGVKWSLVLIVLALAGRAVVRGPGPPDEGRRRAAAGAAACTVAMLVLVGVVALGLLVIENRVTSGFQPAPTFADALLDAAAAVGGAGLSSGLAATVTSFNLSSGIRQASDLYQYGMAWLMAAMFIGRLAPVLVLGRAARAASARGAADLPLLA